MAVKLLQPDPGPVLVHKLGQEFQVAQDFEPFGEIQLQKLFNRGRQESSTPAFAVQMAHRTTHTASGCVKEQVDVRVDL